MKCQSNDARGHVPVTPLIPQNILLESVENPPLKEFHRFEFQTRHGSIRSLDQISELQKQDMHLDRTDSQNHPHTLCCCSTFSEVFRMRQAAINRSPRETMRCIVVPNLTLLRSQWLRRHSIPFFAAPMVTTCAGNRRSLQRSGPTRLCRKSLLTIPNDKTNRDFILVPVACRPGAG